MGGASLLEPLGTPVRRLHAGGCLAVIAPAGPAEIDVQAAQDWAFSKGYRLKLFPGVYEKQGYLAGPDARRLEDLHAAFSDPEVDAILCLRGGYGCPRLLDKVDFSLLRHYAKPFVGYSDLTALQLAIALEAGFVTFHGPMLRPDILTPREAPTERALLDMLTGLLGVGDDISHPEGYPLRTLAPGVSEGILLGGNLAMICSSLGSPWEVSTEGRVLFMEDVNEPLYRIDRLLNQLRLAGKLEGVAGILVGDFAGLDPEALDLLFQEYFGHRGIPVLSGWKSGHCNPNLTLPLGARVRLDATQKRLTLLQDVVT